MDTLLSISIVIAPTKKCEGEEKLLKHAFYISIQITFCSYGNANILNILFRDKARKESLLARSLAHSDSQNISP